MQRGGVSQHLGLKANGSGSAGAPPAVPGAPAGNIGNPPGEAAIQRDAMRAGDESSARAPKTAGEGARAPQYRDRTSQTLFIDAGKLGYMIDRVLRAFTAEDLEKITGSFQKWKRSAADYADLPGFCKSATLKNRRP